MKKAYRIFILTLAFIILLFQFVDLRLSFLLLGEKYFYPKLSDANEFRYIFIYIIDWAIPLLCSINFVVHTGLANKIANKIPFLFLQATVILYLFGIIFYSTIYTKFSNTTLIEKYILIILNNPLAIFILISFILSFAPKEKQ